MALPASSLLLPSSSSPKFPSKVVIGRQPCQLQKSLFLGNCEDKLSKRVIKMSMPQFGGSEEVEMQINVAKEKLRKAIPDSIKEVEWNKASELLLERLLSLGKKALQWSIIVLFSLSSVSDFVFSVSRNQELMIPFGLLVGCLAADFLKETSQEVFPSSQGKGLEKNLIGIGCFFVLVKCLSAYFGIRGKVFLFHVVNGGFMQVLWLWKTLLKREG
ncbi:hypothetical protein TIFTF001_005631 [Ficus carica]|uniref:Uncharacterized protein n=1 Tax=Ficus carica TaxID=3494 RepID=A0AA87ZFE4_FICCA|nr:hypothetical protein TIFTF001_005631 [Ficus carica]